MSHICDPPNERAWNRSQIENDIVMPAERVSIRTPTLHIRQAERMMVTIAVDASILPITAIKQLVDIRVEQKTVLR